VLVVPPGSPAHTTILPRSDEHALAG
jgi:hypothetical protein